MRLVGNCFESLQGPAIYANNIGALTISGSYYEANNLNPGRFQFVGQPTMCAEVVLNAAGNQTAGHWPATLWGTNPARLAALVTRGPVCPGCPKYTMAPQPLVAGRIRGSAIIEGSYYNPDHSHCPSTQYYGVYVTTGAPSGVSVRNNDCRACAKAHANRTCAVVGGADRDAVEQTRNTGTWST